jgi:hypothetical protein
MTKHWDAFNPWRDCIVYVPIERLAECSAGGNISTQEGVVPLTVEWLLKHWAQCGRDKLDAYILPQPHGRHSLGVRYGLEGSEYYSPHNTHPELAQALLEEFTR